MTLKNEPSTEFFLNEIKKAYHRGIEDTLEIIEYGIKNGNGIDQIINIIKKSLTK